MNIKQQFFWLSTTGFSLHYKYELEIFFGPLDSFAFCLRKTAIFLAIQNRLYQIETTATGIKCL